MHLPLTSAKSRSSVFSQHPPSRPFIFLKIHPFVFHIILKKVLPSITTPFEYNSLCMNFGRLLAVVRRVALWATLRVPVVKPAVVLRSGRSPERLLLGMPPSELAEGNLSKTQMIARTAKPDHICQHLQASPKVPMRRDDKLRFGVRAPGEGCYLSGRQSPGAEDAARGGSRQASVMTKPMSRRRTQRRW